MKSLNPKNPVQDKETTSGMKETEHGQVASSWRFIPSTEFCHRITDGTHDSPKEQKVGKHLITSKHIKGRQIDFENAYLIKEEDFNKINLRSKVDQWDVIISMIGEYCGFCYVERNSIIDYAVKNVGILKTGKKEKALWLYYYLTSKIGRFILDTNKSGTSQPYLTLGFLRDFPVLYPNTDKEANAIIEVLSSLDDKIDLLHRQNKTLEQLAETLFRQWFVEEAEESWEETSLDKHTEVFRGLSYKGSGLTEEGNGIPMHNLNSIYEFGGYKNEGIKFYNGDYKERHIVNVGDIIVTNTEQGHEHRLIGFPGIVPDSFGKIGIFSQHIYRIIPLNGTYITNQFLYYLLMTPKMREQIIGATNGSTVNMLSIDGLQLPKFCLPPKELVQKFTSVVSDYWEKKNKNTQQIRTLTQLRDSLLPKLMSGEVRLNRI